MVLPPASFRSSTYRDFVLVKEEGDAGLDEHARRVAVALVRREEDNRLDLGAATKRQARCVRVREEGWKPTEKK